MNTKFEACVKLLGHLEKVPVVIFSTGNHPDLVVIEGVNQADEASRFRAIFLRHSRDVSDENGVENLGDCVEGKHC